MTKLTDRSRLPWYIWFGVVVFFLVLASHLFLLTTIPGPIVFDESYYATQAQAIIASGSDLFGQWRPLHLTAANPTYSELTGLVQALGFLLIRTSPVLAMKILPALFGALIPILAGVFVWKVTSDRRSALITILVFSLNPWVFQFSRMGFDSFFGLFLILLGLTSLIALPKYWKLLSFLPFFIGFFQYQGFKVIFLPMILVVGGWVIYQSSGLSKNNFGLKSRIIIKKINEYPDIVATLMVILLASMLTVWFLLTIRSSSAGVRLQEFIWSDSAGITEQVNDQRRLSATSPMLEIASNKATITLNNIWMQTLNAFSPVHFFGRANAAVDTFAVHQHGFLYPIDAVLLIIGFGVLWFAKIKKSSTTILLTSLFLISFLPSILKTDATWITFRGGFTIIFGLMIVAIGFEYLLRHVNKSMRYILVGFYLLFALSFFYHYFFRYPSYSTHNLMYSNRVLSSYLERSSSKVNILSDESENLFHTVLLFGNHISNQSIGDIRNSFINKNYQWQNFSITSGCVSNTIFSGELSTVILRAGIPECQLEDDSTLSKLNYPLQPTHLVTPFDSGTVYTIYGDNVCQVDQLNTFVSPAPPWKPIEKLTDEEFCQSFFVKDLPQ